MTATAVRPGWPAAHVGPGGLRQAIGDGLIVARRNLTRIPRIPELAIFMIIQSIMFVLLFAFVFGGAIPLPNGASYREYLMPGIFVQTITFAVATTALGMCDDINKGIIDRFRSLPMARSAVLSGRTLSDVVYNFGILIVLMISGLAVGWTVHTGLPQLLAGVGLLLLFAFAMSWIGVFLGLSVPTVEVAQQVTFTTVFPLHISSRTSSCRSSTCRLACADHRVESGQRPDRIGASALRQPESVRQLRAAGRAADPRDPALGRGHPRRVRSARGATLPLDESLTRESGTASTARRSRSTASSQPASSPAVGGKVVHPDAGGRRR